MASNVVNPKVAQAAIGVGLDAVLGSEWDVFSYSTVNFNGKARNLVISRTLTRYLDQAAKSDENTAADAIFEFNIVIFVLFASSSENWTAQNSDDALALGRKVVADWLRDNLETANWNRLEQIRDSSPIVIPDEQGVPYRCEVVPVRATIWA